MPSPIFTVFKKELIDTLRDRRTLVAMILVPILLTPGLMLGSSSLMQSKAREALAKQLHVAVVDPFGDSGVAEALRKQPNIDVELVDDPATLPARIRGEQLDAAVTVDPTFKDNLARDWPGQVTLVYRSGNDLKIAQERIKAGLKQRSDEILKERLARHDLDEKAIHGLEIREEDLADQREQAAKILGGLLPYLFIIFCFTGSMYPAIDLAAGEKERGTLETLLTAPIHRSVFVLGKFAIVTLTGFVSALIAMLGMFLTLTQFSDQLPAPIVEGARHLLNPAPLAAIFALILPMSMFFAALLLMLSVYARTYKEAMSIVSPLMIVVLVPAMVTLLPGTRLTLATALVPVLNVSLATRELLSGTAQPGLVAVVFASLMLLAGVSLWACTRWFAREDIVFRA